MEVWEDSKEKYENKRKAIILTFILNVLLLAGLYFMVAWRQPIPPMSQFGLELNLGFSDVGSGDNQTEVPPSPVNEPATEASAPGDPAPQPIESTVPATPPKASTERSEPQQAAPAFETPSRTPSPVKAEEKASETTQKPQENPSTPAARPSVPETKPEVEETPEEKPKVDPRAIFGAGGTRGSSERPAQGSNQGSSNQQGDEGNPQGTVDGRSILQTGRGNAGDGAGYNLDLAGWDFDSKPNIQDQISNRNGKIVFRITVNDNGKIVQAIPLEYTVSNEVLNYYRTVVNQLSFKRQSDNPTAEYSKGLITFIIKVD